MALTWKYDLETASPFTPSPNFGNTGRTASGALLLNGCQDPGSFAA